MTINVLFADHPKYWDRYQTHLSEAFSSAGLDVKLAQHIDNPSDVDYMVYSPIGPVTDFTPFTNLKAVLNLWAGVEKIEGNPTLKVPLCRMVDAGLSEGMVEWVTGHVLRYHLGMDAHINGQDGVWRHHIVPPLARNRKVGFLGLGELGTACAQAAAQLNFDVSGWARSHKSIEGIKSYSGKDGLEEVLSHSEILVLLLPATRETNNIINDETLSQMPKGARIINAGRGQLIDDDALLSALNDGHVAHATLDVFHEEPLPPSNPYWEHPNVTVTPHIASESRPETTALVIADNIRRCEAGEELLYEVDRKAGY